MRSGARSGDIANLLRFDVAGLHCVIDAAFVSQVLRAAALEVLPGAPEFIAGIVNVHGELVPVVNLRVRFGHEAREIVPSDRFILVHIDERVIALHVDAVFDIIELRSEAIVPAGGLILGAPSLAGVARTAEGMVYIHNPAAFLSESEVAALDQLGAPL